MFLLKNLQASLKRNKKRHEGWRTQGPWVLSCLGSRLTKIDVARGKVHDCLWVFTRISTPVGPLSLADLVSHSHAIRIVSVHGYDHECMNMHIICMNVCRKCGKLPKPSQAMRHQLNVMSVLSLASCKPLYRNLTQLNFETGAECSQNVAIYRATKLQTKDDNTCENQKKIKRHAGYCWMSDWVKFTHVSCRNASSSRLNRSNQAAKMKQIWWHSLNRVNVLKAHGVWLLCNCQTCCVIFAEL